MKLSREEALELLRQLNLRMIKSKLVTEVIRETGGLIIVKTHHVEEKE